MDIGAVRARDADSGGHCAFWANESRAGLKERRPIIRNVELRETRSRSTCVERFAWNTVSSAGSVRTSNHFATGRTHVQDAGAMHEWKCCVRAELDRFAFQCFPSRARTQEKRNVVRQFEVAIANDAATAVMAAKVVRHGIAVNTQHPFPARR